ncbi:uncharacterized protein LOC141908489 [Tubulanus polymorphus]|uniref:uncharacterized protein LOC141908489 n=1 Tax=Tubulanus polymorphus TaxID=672921 RepID=UPI003DA28790
MLRLIKLSFIWSTILFNCQVVHVIQYDAQGETNIFTEYLLYNVRQDRYLRRPMQVCSSEGSEQPVKWTDPKPYPGKSAQLNTLKNLFDSTGGPDWMFHDNWNNDTVNFCLWYGIGCNANGDVISVSLSRNRLNGHVPRLHDLSSLKYLCFNYNANLTGNIDVYLDPQNKAFERLTASFAKTSGHIEFLAGYPKLRLVQLSSNWGVRGRIVKEFCALKDLRIFSLGETSISGSIPDCFGENMPVLRFLDLEYCKNLRSPIPRGFSNLTGVKWMHLSKAQLYGKIPDGFGLQLQQNEELHLDSNELRGNIPDSIGAMKKLKFIRLGENDFTGNLPSNLVNLKNLRYLGVERNHITLSADQTPFRNPKLYSIDLSYNPLNISFERFMKIFPPTAGSFTPIIEVSRLEFIKCRSCGLNGKLFEDYKYSLFMYKTAVVIDFSYNRIKGTLPGYNPEMNYLIELYLRMNELEGAIPRSFNVFSSLSLLDLTDNPAMYWDPDNHILEFSTDSTRNIQEEHLECPDVSLSLLKSTPSKVNGALLIDPGYYGYENCTCNEGYFGSKGLCKPCLNGGNCSMINSPNKTITYKENWYPSLVNGTLYGFVECFASKPICNPFGNCSCYMIDDSAPGDYKISGRVVCDHRCVCNPNYNLFDRKCSRCKRVSDNGDSAYPKFYKAGDICLACDAKENLFATKWQIIIFSLISLTIFVVLPILTRCVPVLRRRIGSIKIWSKIITIVAVFLLAIFRMVSIWVFQVTVLFVILNSINDSYSLNGLLKQLLFFGQITSTIFAQIHLPAIDAIVKFISYYVEDPFSFRFESLKCQFPILRSPLANLVISLAIPIVAAVLAFLAIVFRYAFERVRNIVGRCRAVDVALRPMLGGENDNQEVRSHKMLLFVYQCVGLVLFVIDCAFYPIFKSSFSILLPCERDPDGTMYMPRFPYLSCGSDDCHYYTVVASTAVAVFGLVLSIVVIVCLVYYESMRADLEIHPDNDDALRKKELFDALIGKLADPFRPPHSRYMAFLFMVQKVVLAAVFSFVSSDLSVCVFLVSVLFTVLLLHQVYFRPFRKECIPDFDIENTLYFLSLFVLLISSITVKVIASSNGAHVIGYIVFTMASFLILVYLLISVFRIFSGICSNR